jgi:DeoR family transcriptional regulator, aga operon transcriptional repressor
MAVLSNADKRREIITQQLARENVVRVAQLSRSFGVSEVSIRRDLERLERQGLLQRVHGGAVAMAVGSGAAELASAQSFHVDEKRRIGQAAAALVRPGERVIFDSGTTVLEVARSLSTDQARSSNLTAITSSLPIVQELGHRPWVNLLLLGGIYLPEYRVVAGPQAVENLRGLHADKMFLGTDGLTLDHGLTTANVLEAEVDRAMVRAADQIIIVADSSKIGCAGLTTIIPLDEAHVLITDRGAPEGFLDQLRSLGIQVILA